MLLETKHKAHSIHSRELSNKKEVINSIRSTINDSIHNRKEQSE